MGSGGPDHFLELVFASDVRAAVRALDTKGFRRAEIEGQRMTSELRSPLACDAFDLYADATHFEPLVENLRGGVSTNVWVYEVVLVGARRVWIEHGYGATSDACAAAEARLLAWACERGSGLVSWSIEHGGQGYPVTVARAGASWAELRAALAWIPPAR